MTTDTAAAGPSALRRGFKRIGGDSNTDLGIATNDQHRIQFGAATLSNNGANTAALLHGLGTSTTPVQTASGSVNFLGYWVQTSSTSGDVRGLYMRLYFTGAGGTGEAARIFATVSDVAASTVRGAHISLDFASTGTVTGLGVALECTLHIANQATQAGTMAPIKLAINSDGSTSDPASSQLSYIRVDNQGDSTGGADVDDDVYLFDIQGHTIGDGNLVEVAADETGYAHNIRIRVGATEMYLMCADDRV